MDGLSRLWQMNGLIELFKPNHHLGDAQRRTVGPSPEEFCRETRLSVLGYISYSLTLVGRGMDVFGDALGSPIYDLCCAPDQAKGVPRCLSPPGRAGISKTFCQRPDVTLPQQATYLIDRPFCFVKIQRGAREK